MESRVRAGASPTRGRCCARRRCSARPTSSSRPARRTRSRSPRTGRWRRRRSPPTVELDEILRAFDPKTRKAWQTWMQAQAQGIDGYGRDINDALGNLGPFAEDTATLVDILNRQQGAVSRLISNSGVVFGALTERQGQLRSLIRNSNTVFATTAARDQQLKESVHRAADVRGRVARDRPAAGASSRPTPNPLVTQLRPGGARAEPDADGPRRARAGPQAAVRRAQPADRRVQDRLPGRRSRCSRTCGRCSRRSTRPRSSSCRCWTSSGSTSRELNAFFANTVAATQARSTSTRVHYLRTTNPFNPENLARLSAPARHQPAQRRTPSRACSTSSAAGSRSTRTATAAARSRASPTTPLARADVPTPAAARPPGPSRCRRRCRPTEELQALVPDELLDRINKFAFANAPAGTAPGAGLQEAGALHLRRRDDAVPAREGRHGPLAPDRERRPRTRADRPGLRPEAGARDRRRRRAGRGRARRWR